VRGINLLVPHAFNPKEYPDWDCPPHFYAHGNNPQFRYFNIFTGYANRMMELFSGGIHQALAAILYHAEMEWSGEYMPVERPARILTEHQVDFDIVSADYLQKAGVRDGQMEIGQERFRVLFVPYCEHLPVTIAERLLYLAKSGLQIVFLQDYPKSVIGDPQNCDTVLADLTAVCSSSAIKKLSRLCNQYREIHITADSDIVYYHYRHIDMDVYMFFNESIAKPYSGQVDIPALGNCYEYDVFHNRLYNVERTKNNGVLSFNIALEPYESKVFILLTAERQAERQFSFINTQHLTWCPRWKIAFADAGSYPKFTEIGELTELTDLRRFAELARASGTALYQTAYSCADADGRWMIELKYAYEVAEVKINGNTAGVRICQPYRFEITGLLREGINQIEIEVTNTLGNTNRDALSQYLAIEPFGIVGSVYIMKEGVLDE
jgi:hypothetical protein